MKAAFILALLLSPVIYVSCTVVGNSPEERRQRKWLALQEEIFERQLYRRAQAAVDDTEAFFTFTNRLSQRDTEPMDLERLGRVMVNDYGSNITWQVVTAAWTNYSAAAPLDQATNVMWLVNQSPRARDTAWLINFRQEWMP